MEYFNTSHPGGFTISKRELNMPITFYILKHLNPPGFEPYFVRPNLMVNSSLLWKNLDEASYTSIGFVLGRRNPESHFLKALRNERSN